MELAKLSFVYGMSHDAKSFSDPQMILPSDEKKKKKKIIIRDVVVWMEALI